MAAERAAALTEAYRVLSHHHLRAAYDRTLDGAAAPSPAEPTAPRARADSGPPQAAAEPAPGAGGGPQFRHERARRDVFLRKAAMTRFGQALDATGECERVDAPGFDVACLPRARLFGRSRGPRILGRFVSTVDARSLGETWERAVRWAEGQEACVFLIGPEMSAAGELAAAIGEQKRKFARATGSVVLIPVDARNWEAHVPVDAPALAKTLLARLRAAG
jgi:hypothetical protein